MTAMSESEIQAALTSLPAWAAEGGALTRRFTFPTFLAGIAFVNRVARVAEEVGHHPDITITYTAVTLRLATHDAGGVTAKDVDLARRLDPLASAGA
ncbi:MAG TPA: 4a-hydroxytetrahydrobiopterin dehydratase [Ktedonobacterales bacterium]|nr:4a-hydroxytetrahydrobiopterin dehydratase [Ktedonobacterales bacterium]